METIETMEITIKIILVALFFSLLLFGVATGDFFETWKNGATL
ncbi:Conserved hypothetical protein [Desulfamplus magnetovallimortis]|uniref:Uncharacterized protein n=1 Tax=Desulfamplus magnetovallimortis TaxID=1246637 RepID=L0R6Q6_9BACT|nr:hypothetical protein [Desulfamplus magnetovallimortis]CCO06681.1 Conserved hypothetical protein [Desulfamplus magnetovallimortis BW-1]SLM32732.1 Conserved hypothetical protein [Desulfamplus magnetovallimortis]